MINQNLKILHSAFPYFTGLRSSNITRISVLSQIFDTARNAYCILSDQYTDNSTSFLFLFMVGTEQEETESSDLKKKQYVGFEILVYHENLVTISCFRTFLSILHLQFFHLF